MRVALGGSRWRLLQQFLSESLLFSLLGGGLGVLLAVWCTHFLLAIFPNGVANLSIPRVEAIPIDAPVLWFALGIDGRDRAAVRSDPCVAIGPRERQ